MRYLYLLLSILSVPELSAQVKISGSVIDKADKSELAGVGILLLSAKDSTFIKGTATNEHGKFEITSASGKYLLKFTFLSYKTNVIPLEVKKEDIALPVVSLAEDVKELKGVVIEQTAVRATQKEDTTEFNSSGFKTNRDASTEELIQKMPGITIENGTVKAKGEEVKKVLVDGKPFFGSDPSTALKNLPAEAVDKIQVYDQMSDQSRFTGFNDGNDQRTINIVTKPNMNNGVFGKVYGGYGYLNAHRYNAGANVNWFNGNRRVSVLAMSNNINQQNFSIDDLMGLSGNSGGGGMGRMRMMGGGPRPPMGGNSTISNFMVGQQSGISTAHAVGINYSDQWSNKVKVTGSYFFNLTDNSNSSETDRQYFSSGETSTRYKETAGATTRNINHRFNFKFEYAIDSNNSLFITPKLSVQQYNQKSTTMGVNTLLNGGEISSLSSKYTSSNLGYNASLNTLFQHKFLKKGRTFSIDITGGVNNNNGKSSLHSENGFSLLQDTVELNQQSDNGVQNYSGSAIVSYTEPITELSLMQFSYAPSYTWSKRDKNTYDSDTLTGDYTQRNYQLSNYFENAYMTQRAGFAYRLRSKSDAINFSAGADVQYALLTGAQTFPTESNVRKSFNNVLPNASFKYSFSKQGSIRINYTSSTTPPSITQMQSVIDNSNPLFISIGNPLLKQDYKHSINVRFNNIDAATMRMFFGFVSFTYTQNYIGNSTTIALKDTMLQNNVLVNAGAQLTKPINLSNSINLRSFFGYGLPIKPIKCNMNFHAGVTYSRTPSLINGVQNLSNTVNVAGGLVLASNINENIDFTIHYMGNYNIVKNSLNKQQNNNYYFHNADVRFNWNFWKGFVFNTTLNNTLYAGVAQGFNQNFFLWNASLAYKFLKDRSLEVKASVFDILGQNNSISRTVNETYMEDVRTQVLQRYVMLTITYNLRYFKKAS
ncbi:MAG: TonB-dependent receptor [Chitinophagales bacterium]